MSLRKTEAIVAVLLVFALGISLFRPSMTGFVPAKAERQAINLWIDSSQVYTLRLNETIPIVSLRISGAVIGNGSISIWLGDGDERLLMWSNARPAIPASANMITGLASVTPKEDGSAITFTNECVETCVMPENFQQKNSYDLAFDVEPGTTLRIDEIVYVIID